MKAMNFFKTVGHGKQEEYFFRVIENNTLSHAYLLVGPENIGKTTFALEVSELFGADPVLDTRCLDFEEGISVGQAREIQAHLRLTSFNSKKKSAIITHAENMTAEAANALLKILEEPPPGTVIFLTTSNPQSVIPTIVSRTQKIYFHQNSDDEVFNYLENAKLANGKKIPEIVRLARGRIGIAQRIAGDSESLAFFQRCDEIYETFSAKMHNTASKLNLLNELSGMDSGQVKSILKYAMVRWSHDPDFSPSLGKKILQAYNDLRANLNQKIILDNLFF